MLMNSPSRLDASARTRNALVVALCSIAVGCQNRDESSSAFIEDGTPAIGKPPDRVTEQARDYFAGWLATHGETRVVNDATGVGVVGNSTRLWAFLYGIKGNETGFSAEVEFRVVLPDGREIVEFVAGNGATEDAAIGTAFANFTLSTFHVVYSCFINQADPHMTHERVTIGGTERILTTGGMFAMGSETLPDFAAVSDQLQDELARTGLPDGTHWVKVVYGRQGDDVLAEAVMLDNEGFEDFLPHMRVLEWPSTDEFYIAKQFIVVRPASAVQFAQ